VVDLPVKLVCSGCGSRVSIEERWPFVCPRLGNGGDHVLVCSLDPGILTPAEAQQIFADPEPNPFVRYRRLSYVYHAARARGVADGAFVDLTRRLNAALETSCGTGFSETPFAPNRSLSARLGLVDSGALWIKDETVNVSGSHKARHLFAIVLWLELLELEGVSTRKRRLAIASCGTAALAAALLARCTGREIDVFIPEDAHPAVVAQLEALDAHLTRCPRQTAAVGDPCYLAFRGAVRQGALPFTVQGNQNALTLDGGAPLAYEMVSAALRHAISLDAAFIQVGGGALASSVIQGLHNAQTLGLIQQLPAVYSVQTHGAFPLHRAYTRVAARLSGTGLHPNDIECDGRQTVLEPDPGRDHKIAEALALAPATEIEAALAHAARQRSAFMWPWDKQPRSIASGILDDETYDWLAVVRGTIETGGFPLVVSEETLREAHALARENSEIKVDPTGSAGLAGYLALRRLGILSRTSTYALLFTGIER